jgi:signal transduction histidine kinase/HPt (histidine-containing phosphotransfer) domain-containing protein
VRVHIVGDNQIDRAMIARMLQRGHVPIESIVELTDIAQAASAIDDALPSIVLLDIGSGEEAVDAVLPFIAAQAPRVPVVVLTSGARPETLGKVLTAHAQDFLLKWEFTANDLHRSIRYAMGRHQSAEELRRAKAAAVAASEAKTHFLAVMSHEIRTPLGAVLGMAEVLAGSQLTGEQRHHVDVLQAAGQHLLGVVNDVLDMGKIEAGAVAPDRKAIDVRTLVDGCITMLEARAAAKALALICDVAASVPTTMVGDAQMVRQILINLIGNAIKFSERGQVVLRVTGDDRAGRLRFAVHDTGPGISPDRQAAIFDRFVQADSSTSRTHGGTGLGLAISRGLADLMQGRLTLTSELGRGSCFTLELPLGQPTFSPAPQAPAAPAALASPPPTPMRVLVVEDTPALQALMDAFLRGSGHSLEISSTGAEAVRQLASGDDFDLIMVDLHLPGMDGFETLGQIRRCERERGRSAAPAIAMSADVSAEVRQRCLAAGFVEFLGKPFPRSALHAVLARFAPEDSQRLAPRPRVTEADDEDILLLLPGFLSACRRDLDAAESAISKRDFERCNDMGHRLKGSGGSFGLPDLAEAAGAMEAAAFRRDTAGVERSLRALDAALTKAERGLANRRGEGRARHV